MEEHTGEPIVTPISDPREKPQWPVKVISFNNGPNRQMRRHQLPQLKEGQSYKRNIPYENKDK